MTPQDKKALSVFRRSGHALALKAILQRELIDARSVNESEPASEENRQAVLARKEVLQLLFGDDA